MARRPAGASDVLPSFRILPASYLLRSHHFARAQDSDIEWLKPRQCWLLIFVSHRWETVGHPDPDGRQHRALAALVTGLCDLWDALAAETAQERIRLVPRLDRHGTAQAAVLLSRVNLPGRVLRRSQRESARYFLPDHIGIWYDYTCLPQQPRSPAEEAEFRAGLLAITAGHSPSEWFIATDGIAPVYLGDVVIMAGTWLGLVLGRLGRERQPVDLAAVLRKLAQDAGVQCSVDNDLIYVTLLMLHGETAQDSAIRNFYADCMARHLSGQPLVVRSIGGPEQFLSYENLRLELDSAEPRGSRD